MSTFFLVRHGENDLLGNTLAGRKPGVHLNQLGHQHASVLAKTLAEAGITQIFSSPLERALETAEPLAKSLALQIQIRDGFNELDFGDWTGRSFPELEKDPAWKQWNGSRSTSRAPKGEMMVEAQQRFLLEIQKLQRQLPDGRVAIFSHADPLKSVLMYYLGMSLDLFGRLEISPASTSVLSLTEWGAQIRALNLAPEITRL